MSEYFFIFDGCGSYAVPWWKADMILLCCPLRQVESKVGTELRLATMLEF